MPSSHFFSNLSSSSSSSAAAPSASADMAAASADSSRCSEIWNYLLIPLLVTLSKELPSAKAQLSAILSPPGVGGTVPRCTAPETDLNFRPVIGIVSHPGDGASGRLSNASGASYIAASYVKFVEAAGARVVPLIYNEPSEILYSVRMHAIYSYIFSFLFR